MGSFVAPDIGGAEGRTAAAEPAVGADEKGDTDSESEEHHPRAVTPRVK